MKEVVFVNQLGLGDYFITNGLINHFCSKFDKIFIPVKPAMLETIQCLYSDNSQVIPIVTNGVSSTVECHFECYGVPVLDADVYMHRPHSARWYRWYYEQFGVPYSMRFTDFQLPKCIPLTKEIFDLAVGSHTAYKLVHDMPSTGQQVTFQYPEHSNHSLPVVRIDASVCNNLLSWMQVILRATEIHVMDSSVWNLVHSMGSQIPGKLFYHANRPSNFTYEPWDIKMFSSNTEIVGY